MKNKYPLLIIFLLSLSVIIANSIIVPKITEQYYIGQVLNIELDLSRQKPERLYVQKTTDNSKIELFDVREIADKPWHYLLRIAPFDTGYVSTDRIAIYLMSSDSADTVYVEPFEFYVKSSLTEADSLLKDIAPPVKYKLKFWDYCFPVLVLAFIGLAIYFLSKIKIKKIEKEVEIVDDRPAWLIALELLDSLKRKKLLELGEYLDFYFELSLILRYFLELQFNIKAAEMTTYEIKQALPDIKDKRDVLNILSEMDKTKYAKFTPDFSQAKELYDWVEAYVRSYARVDNPYV